MLSCYMHTPIEKQILQDVYAQYFVPGVTLKEKNATTVGFWSKLQIMEFATHSILTKIHLCLLKRQVTTIEPHLHNP